MNDEKTNKYSDEIFMFEVNGYLSHERRAQIYVKDQENLILLKKHSLTMYTHDKKSRANTSMNDMFQYSIRTDSFC